ncbi:unnamed protein product, partial [Ectocarpus sp. 13 AM-2016]
MIERSTLTDSTQLSANRKIVPIRVRVTKAWLSPPPGVSLREYHCVFYERCLVKTHVCVFVPFTLVPVYTPLGKWTFDVSAGVPSVIEIPQRTFQRMAEDDQDQRLPLYAVCIGNT